MGWGGVSGVLFLVEELLVFYGFWKGDLFFMDVVFKRLFMFLEMFFYVLCIGSF